VDNRIFEKRHFEEMRKNEREKVDLKEVENWYFGNYLKSGYIRSFRNRRALKILKSYYKSECILLEYGCGSGEISLLFSKYFDKVTGFDFSQISILKALKRKRNLERNGKLKNFPYFFCGDASLLGVKNRSVDIVFGHGVLHHIKKYDGIGEELYRILKDGGVAIFAENLGENKFLEKIRKKTWEKKGLLGIEDTLKYKDIEEIGLNFKRVEVIEMSFLSTVKRLFGYRNNFAVRPFILMLFFLDEIILKIFPFLKKYCSESVIIFRK